VCALRAGNSIGSPDSMAPPNHLKILSGGAMRPLMIELVPRFERAQAATVEIEFRLTSALKQAIEGGASFDIAILPRPDLDGLIAHGAIAPGAPDMARSTVGLAIRSGASKPDIGNVAALRRTLSHAQSLAYSDGPSGAYVAALLKKLGMAEEMASKVKLTSGPVAELVASGEAEIGIQQIVAILPVCGAELVGPLPAELQNVIVYAIGISSGTRNATAARSFIAFARTEEANRLMQARGLEPA
jgi:molybdate transport system substrate-binding protein